MALVKHKSVRNALLYVAAHPDWSGGRPVDSPIWEHVARALFDLANNPDTRVVGSVAKSVKAQKIILDRTTGTRRAGTHPAQRSKVQVQYKDLTGGAISDGK